MDPTDWQPPFDLPIPDCRPAGYAALVANARLEVLPHWRWTFVGSTHVHRSLERDGVQYEVLPPRRWPGDEDIQHLLFALRHDGVSLPIARALFRSAPERWAEAITAAVSRTPTGAYARRAWFLYEAVTGLRLSLPDLGQGNYVALLAESRHVVAHPGRAPRQRVRPNLLGTLALAPIVRRTPAVATIDGYSLRDRVHATLELYDADTVRRAISYLYTRETMASFEIENERPPRNRAERFVAILRDAPNIESLSEAVLVELQQAIVEPRFADSGWRGDCVYVGESIDLARQRVHYVAPRPEDVAELMDGFLHMTERLMGDERVDPIVVAALVSFTFVLIHPFTDGNGRIHRWLIHWVLSRKGVTPRDLTVPVSAIMLTRRREYDVALESFSKALMARVSYRLDEEGRITVHGDTVDLYRHPDLTEMTEALHRWLEAAVTDELSRELEFLVSVDRARETAREIVDMPDRLLDLFIRSCRQNEGRLSKAKRTRHFSMLTDEEVRRLEEAVADAFSART